MGCAVVPPYLQDIEAHNSLGLEWTKGVNWISSIWNGALLWLQQRATEAFYGLVMGLEYIWHGLEVAWIETTAFLSGVWTNFCAGTSTCTVLSRLASCPQKATGFMHAPSISFRSAP